MADIHDIKDMPRYNLAVPNQNDSVSRDCVLEAFNTFWCRKHGAMNCVSQDRKIWRCLTCHEGLYISN